MTAIFVFQFRYRPASLKRSSEKAYNLWATKNIRILVLQPHEQETSNLLHSGYISYTCFLKVLSPINKQICFIFAFISMNSSSYSGDHFFKYSITFSVTFTRLSNLY